MDILPEGQEVLYILFKKRSPALHGPPLFWMAAESGPRVYHRQNSGTLMSTQYSAIGNVFLF